MRRAIVHEGAKQLSYEIREIVETAFKLEKSGIRIHWENIGDPIQKGYQLPGWMKDIISRLTTSNKSYRYTHSQGEIETRRFLAGLNNQRNGAQITEDDVIFFNGLGDAVAKLFGYLKREARVIGPSPAYSTHSSAEAAHSGYAHLSYNLDPENNWLPDIQDLRNKVHYNDSIAGILLINPDNPTGIVYSKEVLKSIVDIAREYDLFIICDETYANVVFDTDSWTFLSQIVGDVPAISMRSVSKEYPWPGARCGWIEVYNRTKDREFNEYISSIIKAKRLEVCSTTLPQLSIPIIMDDPRYKEHISERSAIYAARAEEAFQAFSGIPGIKFIKPQGALYATAVFDSPETIHPEAIELSQEQEALLFPQLQTAPPDKAFVYRMLAATGICTVPLSGFYSDLPGFRFTLLEENDDIRKQVYATIAQHVKLVLKQPVSH